MRTLAPPLLLGAILLAFAKLFPQLLRRYSETGIERRDPPLDVGFKLPPCYAKLRKEFVGIESALFAHR
jgi:hypothetical protein